MKKLAMLLLLTSSVQAADLSQAIAADLPQYEVSGFPITPVQAMVLQPTQKMQESIPTTTPPELYRAVMVTHGNGRVHTVKFYVATLAEHGAIIAALRDYPELAARVRSSKNILFVDGYEPMHVNLGH